MNLFSKERREQRLEERIEQISTDVADEIIKRLSLQQSPDDGLAFRRYRIGKKPRGIGVEDYVGEVKAAIFCKLGEAGVTGSVHFDEEASLVASTKPIYPEPGYSELIPNKDGVVLVFTKPPVMA